MLVLVAQALPEIASLDHKTCELGTVEVPATALRAVAFFHAWCLVELAAALDAGLPIVIRCGNAALDGAGGGLAFVDDGAALTNLQFLVDVTAAEAGMPADLTRILVEVAARPGGVSVLSAEIARAVAGAAQMQEWRSDMSEEAAATVQAAGRGTPWRLVALPPPARCAAVNFAAGCGILPALAILLAAGSDLDACDESYPRAAAR